MEKGAAADAGAGRGIEQVMPAAAGDRAIRHAPVAPDREAEAGHAFQPSRTAWPG
jgi:hypothetical protein